MARAITEAVSLRSAQGAKSEGYIRIELWEKKERSRRSLKYLGVIWGVGLCAVFLPIVHFILVPACLLGGPFLAAYTYGQEGTILGGEGVCPSCNSAMKIASGGVRKEFRDLCTSCQNEVLVVRVDPQC